MKKMIYCTEVMIWLCHLIRGQMLIVLGGSLLNTQNLAIVINGVCYIESSLSWRRLNFPTYVKTNLSWMWDRFRPRCGVSGIGPVGVKPASGLWYVGGRWGACSALECAVLAGLGRIERPSSGSGPEPRPSGC